MDDHQKKLKHNKATWRIMEQLLEVDNMEEALSGSRKNRWECRWR